MYLYTIAMILIFNNLRILLTLLSLPYSIGVDDSTARRKYGKGRGSNQCLCPSPIPRTEGPAFHR